MLQLKNNPKSLSCEHLKQKIITYLDLIQIEIHDMWLKKHILIIYYCIQPNF